MRQVAFGLAAAVTLAGGGALAVRAYDGPAFLLTGGVVPGRYVVAFLAVSAAALVLRHRPPTAALRRAVGVAHPVERVGTAAMTAGRLLLLGAALTLLALAALNPVRLETRVRILLDPGRRSNEITVAPAMLDALRRVSEEFGGDTVCDDPRVAALAASGGSPAELWEVVRSLRPLPDRLAETAARVRGRAGECVVVISAGPPGPGARPWPVDAHAHCRWVNVLPGPSESGQPGVKLASVTLADDPAVANSLSVTIDVSGGVPEPALRVADGGGDAKTFAASGAYGTRRTFRVPLRHDQRPSSAELVAGPGTPASVVMPLVPLPEVQRGRPLRVALGAGLESLRGFPVLRRPEAETAVRWDAGRPAVRWVLGPVAPAARDGVTGPVVEVVPAEAVTPRAVRLERTVDYYRTPMSPVFPLAGLAGWQRLPSALTPGEKALVVQLDEDDAPVGPLVVRTTRPDWVRVVLPPRGLWAAEAPPGWFGDDRKQAAAQMLLIASGLALRAGADHPLPIRCANHLPAEEFDGPTSFRDPPRAGPLAAQLWRAAGGGLDAAGVRTPANSARLELVRAAFALLSVPLLLSAAASLLYLFTRQKGEVR